MQATPAIVTDPQYIKFPAACVECGAPPARTFQLSGRRRDCVHLHVPVCDPCGERKALHQALWVIGAFALAIGIAVGLAAASDALIAVVPAMRDVILPVLLVIFAASSVVVWAALRAGRRAFHRRFSAVWIDRVERIDVTLGVRRDELRRDIAALSGLAGAHGTADEAPYRGVAHVPPAAYDGRARPKPAGWILLLLGIGFLVAGIHEYISLGHAEARHAPIRRHWLEIALYRLGGRTAVLALFLVVGIATIAAGIKLWRSARHRRIGMASAAVGDTPR